MDYYHYDYYHYHYHRRASGTPNRTLTGQPPI
jgi:hypothetical protein